MNVRAAETAAWALIWDLLGCWKPKQVARCPAHAPRSWLRYRGVWNTCQVQRARRRDRVSGVTSIPDDMSRETLRLGMSGSATAFSPNAGVIGLLASILVWISSYTAYL